MAVIAPALHLNSIEQPATFADFKNAFTPARRSRNLRRDFSDLARCRRLLALHYRRTANSLRAVHRDVHSRSGATCGDAPLALFRTHIPSRSFCLSAAHAARIKPCNSPRTASGKRSDEIHSCGGLSLMDLAGIVCFVQHQATLIPISSVKSWIFSVTNRRPRESAFRHQKQTEEEMEKIVPFHQGMGEHFLLSHSDSDLLEMIKGYPGENPFSQ